YLSVQQVHRSMANDPQIQLAHDLGSRMSSGLPVETIRPADSIDLEQSLGIFTETFDVSGKPLLSNGFISGRMPQFPRGAIEYVRDHGEDQVTWQPQSNVRVATVILKLNHSTAGYLLVGRSL